MIDLKPRSKDSRKWLSLYQLRDVWGYSAHNRTPIMLRLRGLCVDGEPPIDDPNPFTVEFFPKHENIYEFLSCNGTVRDGNLAGEGWTAPRLSSTNAALLWPETLRHFLTIIRQVTPGLTDIESAPLDTMEATGLTVRRGVASSWPHDACALVTGGQSCTSPDSMRI